MFFVQTSTTTPRMRRNLTKHRQYCMQNNQLLTKTPIELKDKSIMLVKVSTWLGTNTKGYMFMWTCPEYPAIFYNWCFLVCTSCHYLEHIIYLSECKDKIKICSLPLVIWEGVAWSCNTPHIFLSVITYNTGMIPWPKPIRTRLSTIDYHWCRLRWNDRYYQDPQVLPIFSASPKILCAGNNHVENQGHSSSTQAVVHTAHRNWF